MKDYPYRQGANALVIDTDNNFLLVQKQSYAENAKKVVEDRRLY